MDPEGFYPKESEGLDRGESHTVGGSEPLLKRDGFLCAEEVIRKGVACGRMFI